MAEAVADVGGLGLDTCRICKTQDRHQDKYMVCCSYRAHKGPSWAHYSCLGFPGTSKTALGQTSRILNCAGVMFVCEVCRQLEAWNLMVEQDVSELSGKSELKVKLDSPASDSITEIRPDDPPVVRESNDSSVLIDPSISSGLDVSLLVLTQPGETKDPVLAQGTGAIASTAASNSVEKSTSTHIIDDQGSSAAGASERKPTPDGEPVPGRRSLQTSTRHGTSTAGASLPKRRPTPRTPEAREQFRVEAVSEELKKIKPSTRVLIIGDSHLRFCQNISVPRNEVQMIQVGGLCAQATAQALQGAERSQPQVAKVLICLGTNDLIHHRNADHKRSLQSLSLHLSKHFPQAKLHLLLPFRSRSGKKVSDSLISKWNQSIPTEQFKVHPSPVVEKRDFRDELHLNKDSDSFRSFFQNLCRLCSVPFVGKSIPQRRTVQGLSYSRVAAPVPLSSLDFSGNHPVKNRVSVPSIFHKPEKAESPPPQQLSIPSLSTAESQCDLWTVINSMNRQMKQQQELLQLIATKTFLS